MNLATWATLITAIVGGCSGLAALYNSIFNQAGARALAANQIVETDIKKQQAADKRRDDFQEDLVKRADYFESRADDCEHRCEELRREVEAVRGVLYMLCESLEDRIIPLSWEENFQVEILRRETRQIIYEARLNLRRPSISDENGDTGGIPVVHDN